MTCISHGIIEPCFWCSEERKLNSLFAVKELDIATNQKVSEGKVVRVFKTERAARNYCDKRNNVQTSKYYTVVLRDKE